MDMPGIRIDEMQPVATPSRDHRVAVMKDDVAGQMTVGQLLDLLTGAAPGSLDTLFELAAALGDDPNFSATVTAQLASKADASAMTAALALKANADAVLPLSGGTMTGPIIRPMGEGVRGRLIGAKLSNAAGDVTNDIAFADGTVASDTTVPRLFTVAAMTKRLDAAWAAGNNTGGRDTGAIADGTWHCFAILNPTTYASDFLFSLSATAPTLPAGYTHFRRIGSIIRSGGAIRRFTQNGDRFLYRSAIEDRNSTSELGLDGTTLFACSVPAGIKVNPILGFQYESTNTLTRCTITAGSADEGTVTTHVGVCRGGATDLTNMSVLTEIYETDTSSRLYMRIVISSGALATGIITTNGWLDTRGRL